MEKIIFENENGKILKTENGELFVYDKDGKKKIKSVFDSDGLKNIFPYLFGGK